ncbi:3'-5' exonuclease [Arundinibacter roseus]|uniref:3'-5' exonuclease n=1 Tax=Arundinibacter roseus TaxID=2070510 RepID=A0A4R4K370_9BACT|nr:3'-5' exonuclease [Arundinibacter roseus]TDB61817.1 3'-5' exonuclease [Arundinibacter roseus]
MMQKLFQEVRAYFGSSEPYPDFYQQYAEQDFSKNLRLPFEEITCTVFDTETTGLDAGKDKILSIGAIQLKGNELFVGKSLSILVRQKQDFKIAAIHGIIRNEEDGMEQSEAIRQFLEFIGTSVLIGHHVDFDIAMINAALKGMQAGPLKNQKIDTAHLAARLNSSPDALPQAGQFSLDVLCKQYGLVTKARHTADGDAYLTAILFLHLRHRLRERGVHSLQALTQKKRRLL